MAQAMDTQQMTQQSQASRRSLRVYVVTLLVAAGLLYVGAVAYMYVNQRDILFKPGDELADPNTIGLADVQARVVTMADGTEIMTWSAPPATAGAATVLFLHGQGGSLSDRAGRMREILNSGFGLLAPSYRGYPGSEGEASEDALISDAVALFDQLDADGTAVVLHGQSLGTGVAAAVAAQRPNAELLVLEAPFTATVDVAAERYPLLPVHWLMQDQFATRDIIQDIDVPTLIFHGTDDQTVPVQHGQSLHAMSPDNTQLFVVPGGGHNDLWDHGLWQDVQRVLTAN